MSTTLSPKLVRHAILETLPDETSLFGSPPAPKFTHVPASHAKALHPDVQVVIGMRGSGKSFWWAALQEESIRRLVAQRCRALRLFETATVYAGFGERPSPEDYPSKDTLARLLKDFHDSRVIWRTVVVHALKWSGLTGVTDWATRIKHVVARPQAVDEFLSQEDTRLLNNSHYVILLFDALDRCASDRETMNQLIRGLLQAALDFRPYRRLRLKIFLRSDQLDERTVANFPDASKVLSSSVELSWPPTELYAMFFQYLGNSGFEEVNEAAASQFGELWDKAEDIWIPVEQLAQDPEKQRELFHAISGPWMGRDRRRGFPYSWIPGHLADAQRRTSPRSFLAALRKAAEDSEERYRGHEWALHYESIKRGVQKASEIRRRELQEDFPWVDVLLTPLAGLIVPCSFEEVASVWERQDVQRQIEVSKSPGDTLPPPSLAKGVVGLREDLEQLGIFQRLANDRVNIPDVFRVAYEIKRKGGVKPLTRGEK